MPKRGETVSLAPPPEDPAELEGFPRMVLESVTCLYRVGRAERSPWWFGSSLEGRFDLPEPDGTCYVALDPLTALLEVIGPDRERGYLSAEHLARRRVYELRSDGPADEEKEIGPQMLERLETRYGLKVLRIPHSSQIEVKHPDHGTQ